MNESSSMLDDFKKLLDERHTSVISKLDIIEQLQRETNGRLREAETSIAVTTTTLFWHKVIGASCFAAFAVVGFYLLTR